MPEYEHRSPHHLSLGEKKNDGGQFFTPREVIRLIVDVVKPKIGKSVYDPCCGTGGFLAQAYEFMARGLAARGSSRLFQAAAKESPRRGSDTDGATLRRKVGQRPVTAREIVVSGLTCSRKAAARCITSPSN